MPMCELWLSVVVISSIMATILSCQELTLPVTACILTLTNLTATSKSSCIYDHPFSLRILVKAWNCHLLRHTQVFCVIVVFCVVV